MNFPPVIDFIRRHPKTSCFIAGILTAPAFFTHPVTPALCMVGVLFIVMQGETRAMRGAICAFAYAMGLFLVSLYWVQNALAITMWEYWYLRIAGFFFLPVSISLVWAVITYVTLRITTANTMGRLLGFFTALVIAEYLRGFIFTGFPWNLFAHTWISVPAIMQVSAIAGTYVLMAFTMLWAATPAMLWIARANKNFVRALSVFTILSMGACLVYGSIRLARHPTEFRDDVGAIVVQPNLVQADKWDTNKVMDHFYKHIRLSKEGLEKAEKTFPETIKTIAILWPETSLDETVVLERPQVPQEIGDLLQGSRFKGYLVSGLWRIGNRGTQGQRDYFNSLTVLTMNPDGLAMEALYDKVHLVPFGEYIPLIEDLGFKAISGFAGFKPGPGTKVLNAPGLPPLAAIICYEAIFPWAIDGEDAEWIANASNDAWYGDTMGPHQHLAITRFRAIEQGLPILRTATNGISTVIDSYGRVLETIPYETEGAIVIPMPQMASTVPEYRSIREYGFLALVGYMLAISIVFRRRTL